LTDTVLIAGASGIIGGAAVDHFAASGWDVISVSRRPPEAGELPNLRHLSVDLRDRNACELAFQSVPEVTHMVYAALYEKPGLVAGWQEQDQMNTNLTMLQNVHEPLSSSSALRHITLFQGAKAYGSHLHDIRIPSKESEPRDAHANFYWLQEDYLRQVAESDFAFTILRPQIVIGGAIGVAMNVLPAIGTYAAMCRELGEPCGFPGGPPFVWEAADSRLLGSCCEWAGTSPAAAGETFNVTNGDVFAWRDLWPGMMETLGVEAGPDEPVPLSKFLPEHGPLWDTIVERYGLRPLRLGQVLGESHFMADYCFGYGQDTPTRPKFLSTIKLRRAGFTECMDTEESFRYWLTQMVHRRVLPPGRGGDLSSLAGSAETR
jgi:nucleoside-diphosphate-sugar epimerase